MKKISLQTKLEDCFVPKRFIDVIKREAEDIRTIFDLVSLTRREFLRMEFVGLRCLSVWDEFLEQYGLCIGMTVKEILQYEPDGIIQFYLESGKLHSKFISSLNCNPESNIDREQGQKFDPKTLKPYDKVLAKIGTERYYTWFPDFVSFPANDINDKIACIGKGFVFMAIPYNDETKHLIDTNDEAPEFYKYWEE